MGLRMKIRTFLVATVAAASLGLPAVAADNILLNQWYTASFAGTPSPLAPAAAFGTNGPVLPGGFGVAIATPTAPWTITLTRGGTLTVTDLQTAGDQFTLFDNGIAMTPAASPFTAAGQNPGQAGAAGGNTSTPGCIGCETGLGNINTALGDANYSSGTFQLGQGANVITGTFNGSIGNGDVDFIAEVTAVPEAATWAMMLGGIAAVGAGLRMRRRTTAVLA
jgi:hypothetical protein